MISTPPDTGYLPCLLEAGHKGIHETQLDRDEQQQVLRCYGSGSTNGEWPACCSARFRWATPKTTIGISAQRRAAKPGGPPVTAGTPVPQRLDYLEDREANLAHVVGALEKEHKALVKRLDDVEWSAVARTAAQRHRDAAGRTGERPRAYATG